VPTIGNANCPRSRLVFTQNIMPQVTPPAAIRQVSHGTQTVNSSDIIPSVADTTASTKFVLLLLLKFVLLLLL
jgi:hypothetical protein